MNFCKLIAASDNRGKNIYFYVDPKTHLIGWHQDDLDTIFPVNNVGQREKPYYVEEHDKTMMEVFIGIAKEMHYLTKWKMPFQMNCVPICALYYKQCLN